MMKSTNIGLIALTALTLGGASCGKKGAASSPETVAPATDSARTDSATTDSSTLTHDDGEFTAALDSAYVALRAGQIELALEVIDSVIAHFESEHVQEGVRSYAARSMSETMFYLLQAQLESKDDPEGGVQAVVHGYAWAEAYYLRGYISIGRKEFERGKEWMGKAVELSPANSKYLSELGHIYQVEKDWGRALGAFEAALEGAKFSPEEVKVLRQTRAMRGIGYVLIETGELEKAKAIYEECLRLDPEDAQAKNELRYIQDLLVKARAD